jgi:DUF971 family protein
MAGLEKDTPTPTAITVHQQSRVFEIGFSTDEVFRIPFELMRVYSPSAEVQGHGPGHLYQLGVNEAELWQRYLDRLQAAGADRDSAMVAVGGHEHGPGCGHHH